MFEVRSLEIQRGAWLETHYFFGIANNTKFNVSTSHWTGRYSKINIITYSI